MIRGAGPIRRFRLRRRGDPYLDRRSGEDRRSVYSIDYFLKGNVDRRGRGERRSSSERRHDCIRINKWSSVCPDQDELAEGKPYIINLRRFRRLR